MTVRSRLIKIRSPRRKNPKNKQKPDTQNTSKQTKARRQQAFKQGRRAEAYARWVLCAKGYRLLVRKFRHPLGEVDLVLRRGRLLVFVEVKFRSDSDASAFRQARVDLVRATLIMQTMLAV